ncbi:hypothetical protein TNIN_119331 [Trichonephila inaurata madagascariensis]|uniref:Uncharacterized protein n=1 Tax=Trichonephila inaurata madagascariensis TaxID=2747483 RepID=A0A8X7C2H8_9ARAC|nr:hypothetical protein TNIN_119331 [Trichonephila inaurata madagascariensis]
MSVNSSEVYANTSRYPASEKLLMSVEATQTQALIKSDAALNGILNAVSMRLGSYSVVQLFVSTESISGNLQGIMSREQGWCHSLKKPLQCEDNLIMQTFESANLRQKPL